MLVCHRTGTAWGSTWLISSLLQPSKWFSLLFLSKCLTSTQALVPDSHSSVSLSPPPANIPLTHTHTHQERDSASSSSPSHGRDVNEQLQRGERQMDGWRDRTQGWKLYSLCNHGISMMFTAAVPSGRKLVFHPLHLQATEVCLSLCYTEQMQVSWWNNQRTWRVTRSLTAITRNSGVLTTSLFVILADTKPKVSIYRQGCFSNSCTADFL